MPERLLYWKGCMSRLRSKGISDSTMALLGKMGIEFDTLGAEEGCCGSVLLRTGQTGAASRVAEETVRRIASRGFGEVITACPGCYRTMSSEYPQIVGDIPFRVRHISQFLMEKEGLLRGRLGTVNARVSYHDPCHLGRHMGVYEEPRQLIRLIPGVELLEMKYNRSRALCCGSGGGVRSAFPELSREVARSVVADNLPGEADLLVTACPFCNFNIKEACPKSLRVLDLPELLLSAWRG
ncbi:MAG: heterodisulfide reductase-related iron-sulfur binding cluster [Candidatus Verstraetearchaeota archaeon]|nr:heterodisulfide reductase-related iron-sulfur binding cluster [Candidatus Verstraetearchaeota archaeon]